MRIDAYNKITQLYQNSTVKKVNAVEVVKAKDKLELSSIGKEYQTAKTAISSVDDIRQEKINDIKKRMQSGTYDVSGKEFADKLVDSFYNSII